MKRHPIIRTDRILVTEKMIRQLDSKHILEIGSGDYSFDYIKALNASWTKADFAPPCDVVCDFNSENVTLPFPENSFDLVICTEVLEHLLWPQRLLEEVHRILTLRGNILVSVPNVSSLSYRIAWAIGRIPSCAASGNLPPKLGSTAYEKVSGRLVGGHVIDFNLKRIRELLTLSGYDVVNVKGSGIIWHRQILSHRLVPASLSSNIVCLGTRR